MLESICIHLSPLNQTLKVVRGTPLREILFSYGVEFPCGGRGQCKGCRVRVLGGDLEVNEAQREMLTEDEIARGWRLSCQCIVKNDLELELAQWKTEILVDESMFEFVPREGLGVAVDLGTTTLAAQILDLRTGRVLGVKTALNQQAQYGSDIMSRVAYAVDAGGQVRLRELVREQVGKLVSDLCNRLRGSEPPDPAARQPLTEIAIVGNTAMHHFFCGVEIKPLSRFPFEPVDDDLKEFTPEDLGWFDLPGAPAVRFLPCLGGFVGSDILAGILATRMHDSEQVVGLVDLGTNGEIVLGNCEKMVCASTAAGPAFEGAKISMGMRAAGGAVYRVEPGNGRFVCKVIGDVPPRGVCGSGLVDAVAVALDLGLILPQGRFKDPDQALMLIPPVSLIQEDIRQLQLAKGAIAAGFRILSDRLGVPQEETACLYLGGAFGNYISRESARRIGLLDFPKDRIQPAGNTALLGAKMALFGGDRNEGLYGAIRKRVEHVPLSADPQFQEIYAEEMLFPS